MKNDFYGDVWYLFKYNGGWALGLIALDIALYLYRGFDPTVHFEPIYLLGAVASFLFASTSFSLIHNASHNNFRYKWLSKIMGETNGFIQLWGYEGFKWLHIFHHRYANDPSKDPHAPVDASFLGYVKIYIQAAIKYVLIVRLDMLREQGVEGKRLAFYGFLFSWSLRLAILGRIALFLLISPTLTVFFLVPFLMGNLFATAHVNYYGHLKPGTRELELSNVTDGAFIKFLNLISFNLWYHKNHHLNPKLFDPKKLPTNNDKTTVKPDQLHEQAS